MNRRLAVPIAVFAAAVLSGCAGTRSSTEPGYLEHPELFPPPKSPDGGLVTVASPLDSLITEIPDIPVGQIEAERERVEAQDDTVAYDIPIDLNVRVLTFVDAYTTKQADWIGRALRRSGRYMPMIRRVFAEEGVPLDLAYMPVVESAFRHNARSRAGAIGMWQFMRGTARRYGLRCDAFVDERLDPERATRAAARYLSDLHEEFQDWYLAMAAYNAGEGRVRRAIRRTSSRDFWEIAKSRHLVRETRNYVPAILAAIVVSKTPEAFGVSYEPEPELAYDSVEVPSVTHVDIVARCCNVPSSVVRALNPALITHQTPPSRRPYTIRIPHASSETFLAALSEIPPDERTLYARHRVRRGQTLSQLARSYGTSVSAIQEANHMGRRTMIRDGQSLVIPTAGADPGFALAALSSRGERIVHRVRRGQTLSAIAKAYGTSVSAIQSWNHVPNPRRLRAGQNLTIYAGVRRATPNDNNHVASNRAPTDTGHAETASAAGLTLHAVRTGDTLWSISRRYGMSVQELRRVNPRLKRSNFIRPGEKLLVTESNTANDRIVHRVRRGETLWDIAGRYGTTVGKLRLWNGMPRGETTIRPGDVLTLYR